MRAPAQPCPYFPEGNAGVGRRGFTLIELSVAMAVLAILASISFRGLNSILEAEAHVRSETRRWNDVAVVIAHMGRDLSLAVPRPVRDGGGGTNAAMIIGRVSDEIRSQVMVTRLGDGDDAASQSDLRRVGYRLRSGTLEYLVWPATDSAPGAIPLVNPVLENVEDFQLRALVHDGSWTSVWPAGQQANALPRAVELQLVLAGGKYVTRIFSLR